MSVEVPSIWISKSQGSFGSISLSGMSAFDVFEFRAKTDWSEVAMSLRVSGSLDLNPLTPTLRHLLNPARLLASIEAKERHLAGKKSLIENRRLKGIHIVALLLEESTHRKTMFACLLFGA